MECRARGPGQAGAQERHRGSHLSHRYNSLDLTTSPPRPTASRTWYMPPGPQDVPPGPDMGHGTPRASRHTHGLRCKTRMLHCCRLSQWPCVPLAAPLASKPQRMSQGRVDHQNPAPQTPLWAGKPWVLSHASPVSHLQQVEPCIPFPLTCSRLSHWLSLSRSVSLAPARATNRVGASATRRVMVMLHG